MAKNLEQKHHVIDVRIAWKVVTATFLLFILILFIWGFFHQSSQPVVFGRYSVSYFAFLLILFLVGSVLLFALWAQYPWLVRTLGNVYLLVIFTIITIAVVEVALRKINPWGIEFFHLLPYHMQGMVDHPELGYVHPKSVSYRLGNNKVELNDNGLRDEEVLVEEVAGIRRILVLGDSVTFGWGVNQGETFSDRMEPRLERLTGEQWQVINAGVNGYNTEQEAAYLRLEGFRYKPETVIVVYVSNDVDPVFDPNLTTWRRYPRWPNSLPEALDRVRHFSFLYQTTKLFARMQALDGQPTSTLGITEHPGWPGSRKALGEIAKLCEENDVNFLVAKSSVDDPKFFRELEELGVEVTSLSHAWREVEPDGRHVSRVDPHPSADVHDKFAEYLVRELLARGWIDKE